jgi:ribosomal protein L7/L12
LPPASSAPVPSAAAQGSLDAVRDLALSNRIIEAIKMYRNLKGVDLKEAKDYVDDLRRARPASK